jgi:hypothetical protein
MSEVIDLSKKREPARYTLHLVHHWDGTVEVLVDDVAETERNKKSITWAMGRALLALKGDAAGRGQDFRYRLADLVSQARHREAIDVASDIIALFDGEAP